MSTNNSGGTPGTGGNAPPSGEPTSTDHGFDATELGQLQEMAALEGVSLESLGIGSPEAGEAPAGGDPAGGGDEGGGGAGAGADDGSAAGAADDTAGGPAAGEPAAGAGEASDGDEDDDGDDAPAGGEPAAVPGDRPPPKRVSFHKFQRVETAKKAAETKAEKLERELAEARVREARFDERLQILTTALQAPPKDEKAAAAEAAAADPEPDPNENLFDWIEWNRRDKARLAQEVADLKNGRQQEAATSDLASTYSADAATFAAEEPNFGPAYRYLVQTRAAELAFFHFGIDVSDPKATMTPAQLAQIKRGVAAEEQAIVAKAIQNGKSPAAAVYGMARARGYKPAPPAAAAAAAAANGTAKPAAPAAAAKPAATKPAGNGAAAAAPAAAVPDVGEEIARITEGQEAALSLSNGGGGGHRPQLNAQKIVAMSEEDFAAAVENMTPEQMREMFGA